MIIILKIIEGFFFGAIGMLAFYSVARLIIDGTDKIKYRNSPEMAINMKNGRNRNKNEKRTTSY